VNFLVYDSSRRLTTVRNLNRQTVYTFDTFGRKRAERDPWTGITRFDYDDGGNLLNRGDALGRKLTYTHDSLDRVTTRADSTGTTTYASVQKGLSFLK
jgi:YD repeat-containing protein